MAQCSKITGKCAICMLQKLNSTFFGEKILHSAGSPSKKFQKTTNFSLSGKQHIALFYSSFCDKSFTFFREIIFTIFFVKLISRKIKSFGGNLEHYAIARFLMIRVYTLEPKTPAPPIYTVMLVILVSQQASSGAYLGFTK